MTWTFRSSTSYEYATGAGGSPVTLSAPAGTVAGDLLVLAYTGRGGPVFHEQLTIPPGWTFANDTHPASPYGAGVLIREASGDAADDLVSFSLIDMPTAANMLCFYGETIDFIDELVDVSDWETNSSAIGLSLQSVTPTVDNCIVVAVTRKHKTATEDGVTCTGQPSGWTLHNQITVAGTTTWAATFSQIQTTAAATASGALSFSTDPTDWYGHNSITLVALAPPYKIDHYYTIYTPGNGGAATNAQVQAGTGTGAITSGSQLGATASTEQLFTATGLTADTIYDLEWVTVKGTNVTRAATTVLQTEFANGEILVLTPPPIVRK